jgi:hypothetical protein
MSHIHTGQLTASKEWAKHLRPWGKRAFWKGERRAGRVEALVQRLA